MAILWTAVVISASLALAFTRGFTASLELLGACLLPVFAVGGTKWSLIRGDTAQRIGGPAIGMLIFVLGYWIAGTFSIRIFGAAYGGHMLAVAGAIIGLTVPLAMGGPPSQPKDRIAKQATGALTSSNGGLNSRQPFSALYAQPKLRTIEQGAHGSISFGGGKKPIMRLSEDANASTVVHLLTMQWLNGLMADAMHEHAPDDLKRDAEVVIEWLGLTDNYEIPNMAYERFAYGFETFLMGCHYDCGEITDTFGEIGASLRLTSKIGDELHPPIAEEVRGMFRRLFNSAK